MISNVENVIKWLQVNELEYWRVKVKEGDNATVFESSETSTFNDNVSKFRSVMDISQGNRYFITASSKKAQSKGNYFEEFKNMETPISNIGNTPSVQANVGATPEEVERRITDAVDRAMDKLEMKRIKEENAELQKIVRENDNTMSRVLKKVEPYIGTIVGSLMGKILPASPQLGIAGLEPEENEFSETNELTQTDNTADATRLQIALEKWSKADPDFIDLIEAVANLAASGDATYNMAKGMLIKK